MPAFSLPGFSTGSHRAFEIEGDSMEPNLFTGDWVVNAFVPQEEWSNLKDGHVYVVVTDDGIVVKRVHSLSNGLELKSDNPYYGNYEVDYSKVKEVWYVRCKISFRLSPPSSLEERVNELESLVFKLSKQIEK